MPFLAYFALQEEYRPFSDLVYFFLGGSGYATVSALHFFEFPSSAVHGPLFPLSVEADFVFLMRTAKRTIGS
jgi:hypothetical protein